MNPATEVKTSPNPAPEIAIVNGGAAAATASALSFPIGYYDFAPRRQHQFSTEPLLCLGRRRQYADRDARGFGQRERLSDVYENRSRLGKEGARTARGAQRGPNICASSSNCPASTQRADGIQAGRCVHERVFPGSK
jgi:hypothetical protein